MDISYFVSNFGIFGGHQIFFLKVMYKFNTTSKCDLNALGFMTNGYVLSKERPE